jgi:hypothetical protein
MEETILQTLAGAGSVALLAGIIFLMYRRDKETSEKRIIDICQGHENRLREDQQQMVQIIKDEQRTRDDNTRALTELTTILERMNGRH